MYYWVYALLCVIIAILIFFILFQRKKYSSRLSKDEKMLLDIGDKCSFYINEYNSLKNTIIEEKNANQNNEEKNIMEKQP